MIKQTTIDKIFDAARVEEVIGDFVNLKRSGSNLKGYSPFNDEKTPSFMVSPSKQIWKDFSSGKGGNVVSFLMEHDRMTYPEALRWLAKKYSIEIEESEQTAEEKQLQSDRESMILVLEFAKNWYKKQLFETDEGKSVGLSYFKERGFRQETLHTYETGFSPQERDAFSKAALEKAYKKEYLLKTGLSVASNGQLIDRFRGRMIFPIHSLSGRVLGFGGRILDSQAKTAKYINSPENEVYHKSKVLYGIYQAKQQIVKDDQCILVEGYTDVMAFHQAGIMNVVSSSGTALTKEQIYLIKRLTKNILVIFDGDRAGINAALRGIDMILEQGLNVKVLLLPDGEDPDSFSKKVATDELISFIDAHTQDFIKFKASLLNDEAKNDPIKKGELIRNIIQSIAKIPNDIQQEIYVKEVAQIMQISEAVLFKELALVQKNNLMRQEKEAQRKQQFAKEETPVPQSMPSVNNRDILEYEIIKLLLLHGTKVIDVENWTFKEVFDDNTYPILEKVTYQTTVAQELHLQLQEDEMAFASDFFKSVYEKLMPDLLQNKPIDIKQFITQLSDKESRIVSDILMQEEKYALANWEKYEVKINPKDYKLAQNVMDVVLNFRRNLLQFKNKELAEKFKDANEAESIEILNQLKDYQLVFKVVSTKVGRFVR